MRRRRESRQAQQQQQQIDIKIGRRHLAGDSFFFQVGRDLYINSSSNRDTEKTQEERRKKQQERRIHNQPTNNQTNSLKKAWKLLHFWTFSLFVSSLQTILLFLYLVLPRPLSFYRNTGVL